MPFSLAGALQQLKDEFDAHYEESARHPMKFCYAMHNFTGGRPGLAKVFENIVEYAKHREGVWFVPVRISLGSGQSTKKANLS